MVADISNHLADLDRLLLNELRTRARFGAAVLQLQELRLSKDRPDAIIQVVQPFSDSIFIHKGTNPSIGLSFELMISCSSPIKSSAMILMDNFGIYFCRRIRTKRPFDISPCHF